MINIRTLITAILAILAVIACGTSFGAEPTTMQPFVLKGNVGVVIRLLRQETPKDIVDHKYGRIQLKVDTSKHNQSIGIKVAF